MDCLTLSKRTMIACLAVMSMAPLAHAQTYSRTEVIEYHDDLAIWVLGQVKKTTCVVSVPVHAACDGQADSVIAQTDYGWKSLPSKTYSFGKLRQTLSYETSLAEQLGTLKTEMDGNGNVITLTSWKRGIPQTITYPSTPEAPAGATQSAVVDNNGWITRITDENGFDTNYTHDAMGRLASTVYPPGDSINWNTAFREFRALDPADWKPPGFVDGQWRLLQVAGNARTVTYHDALWRPILSHTYDEANVAATLSSIRTAYDGEGRVIFQSYPTADLIPPSQGTWTTYDALGRVTAVAQDSELGLLTTLTQYQSGFKTLVTDPRGNQTTTAYRAYDQPSYDWPVAIIHPEGAYTDIARDAFGKPTAITRRNDSGSVSATRSYVYDDYQQLCRANEPETGTTFMGYDGAGNLAWSAAGYASTDVAQCALPEWTTARRVDRAYDARNRITFMAMPDNRGNQSWTYTPDGLIKSSIVDNDGPSAGSVDQTYTYNKRRLLVSESSGPRGSYTWWLGYGYTANGHLASQSYPTGLVVTYSPNAMGQATLVSDTGGQAYASGIGYHPNGAIRQFTYGNGIVHTMAQNIRQLPRRVTDGGVFDFTFGYDANGNTLTIDDVNQVAGAYTGSRNMGYDGLDRLTYAHLHWQQINEFGYDALDNLRSKLHYNGSTSTTQTYWYDARNQLTNVLNESGASVVGLSYDAQGNLQNKNGQTYYFDFGNRLREVGGQQSYQYDAHGRRVTKWSSAGGGQLTRGIYSQSGQMLYEENGTKSIATENIYLGSSVLAIRERAYSASDPVTKFQHTDALGSPVAVTDTTGTVIDRTNWEPYGTAINKASYEGIGYTGHVMDGATELVYMQQRYYDPQIGLFLSVDPVTAYSNPVGMFNRYRYANNNPYKFTDPDGRTAVCGQSSCTINCSSALTCAADYLYVGTVYGGRLLQNAIESIQRSEEASPGREAESQPRPGDAESDEGCIYCVDGANTESGKDYIGSSDDMGRRERDTSDGRDRKGAERVDSYKKGDLADRQNKEQQAMNDRGGKDNLDNKRNEVSPNKWEDRNIRPPGQ